MAKYTDVKRVSATFLHKVRPQKHFWENSNKKKNHIKIIGMFLFIVPEPVKENIQHRNKADEEDCEGRGASEPSAKKSSTCIVL